MTIGAPEGGSLDAMKTGCLMFILAFQTGALAQRFEVFGNLAGGYPFRFEDRGFGNKPSAGAGFGVYHDSGLGVQVEANRTFGLTPTPARCGIAGIPCEGQARQGLSGGVSIVSVDAVYRFGDRLQPYLIGGIGGLWSENVSSVLHLYPDRAIFEEQKWKDSGLAFNAGGGLRIRLGRALSLRPEIRLYHATARSRANLSLLRSSVSIAYGW